jgi:hypothetical protein
VTTPISPALELHYRLSDALGAHDVHPEDRRTIQQAYLEAGGDEATWADLPPDVQALIEQIETTPRESWDDPADVPQPDVPIDDTDE